MKNYLLMLFAICTFTIAQGQMTATFNKTVNTICDGSNCEYTGPSILINEIMVSPLIGDGSIAGDDATRRAEWIELYNPNLCEPINISCYYLGSAAPQPVTAAGEGFQIPSGTIVPAGGFCVVRGVNAIAVPSNLLVANGGNTVEVIVPANITGDGICVTGTTPTRLWFPNNGGWFAFYDAAGVAQDAISWGSQEGIDTAPCVPAHSTCGGSSVTSLASYNNIPANRKEKVYNSAVTGSWGLSIRRATDGGAWVINQGATPTEGTCNGVCIPIYSSTCSGIATVNVTGGSGNYSYAWNDSEGQLTQTAAALCAGTYIVTVTDIDNGGSQTFTVEILDFVPTVTLTINEELCNYGQTVSMNDISTYSPIPSTDQTGEFTGTGISGSDFDVSVSGEGTFPITYTFTDANGCHNNSDVKNVIVHEIPQPQITGLSPEYCIADSIIELTLSPLGGVLTGPGITNTQFNVNDAGVGTHIISYAVENQFGCKDTAKVTVIVNELPTFTLDNTPPNCAQSDGEIIIVPNAGSFPYIYSIDDGVTTQSDSTFSNLPGGLYDIILTDANGCIITMDTSLYTTGAEDPAFSFADYCEGQSNGPTNIASPNGGFSFNPPATDGATIDPSTGVITDGVAGTTYTVEHLTTGICPTSATQNVTVHEMPIMDLDADPIEGMPPLAVDFTNNSTGADDYTWEFGDGSVLQDDAADISHTFIYEGIYTTLLIGETNSGMCTDTAKIKIIVIYPPIDYKFPNVFTPNNDNNNDFFKFVHYENIKSLHILILNRWGNPLFESTDVNFHWNGKVHNTGAECADGTYFYKATLESYAGEEIQEHGFLHLSRD